MAGHTLTAMASGGIYDQIGGGFARYSVDAEWLVPHFEKMLYDNALLARAYLHGWLATGDELHRTVCEETLDWALKEMQAPEGGFYSALDADSEGEEGKFYVWTVDELQEALGPEDSETAIAWFGASPQGNFEGRNILVRGEGPEPARLPVIRERLYETRASRVWPGLDDKRLTSWNALMISALADAGAVLERPDYLDAARGCADFLLEHVRDEQGRLMRTYKSGGARLRGYLEDTPIPAGNSSAALGLLRLAALTGERAYEDRAVGVLRLLHELAPRHALAFGHLLQALDFHLAAVKEVALVGEDRGDLERVLRRRLRPHVVAAGSDSPGVPQHLGREPVGGWEATYVCESFACLRPVTEPEELEALLA